MRERKNIASHKFPFRRCVEDLWAAELNFARYWVAPVLRRPDKTFESETFEIPISQAAGTGKKVARRNGKNTKIINRFMIQDIRSA